MTYKISTWPEGFPGAASPRELCVSTKLTYARRMEIPVEDTALMLRYRDGDAAAFETLYRRHNDSLYRYLLRLSLNPATAEDLFQEAWTKVIDARQRYRPTARFTTWLFRIAHNCFIDHVRRSRRYADTPGFDADDRAHPGEAPEESAERGLARRRLDDALRSLPEEQRDTFLLREEGGFSVDEIALVTGVNRETAKSRLRYAVGKLKQALAEGVVREQ
jgi:RNA polymerase sigma-70 factor (ECF subfamily)